MNKGVGEGSGLGLSMIYGFAKQADGHVKIYSEPDHGTTVKLYLPCALESTSTEGEASQSDEPFSLGTETVLIVEDDEQEIGRASCRERGCQYVWISVGAVELKKQQYDTRKYREK